MNQWNANFISVLRLVFSFFHNFTMVSNGGVSTDGGWHIYTLSTHWSCIRSNTFKVRKKFETHLFFRCILFWFPLSIRMTKIEGIGFLFFKKKKRWCFRNIVSAGYYAASNSFWSSFSLKYFDMCYFDFFTLIFFCWVDFF